MTNEEAIERIKKNICCEENEKKKKQFCLNDCEYGIECCSISLAIQALEKQIPKKVIRKHTKYKPHQTDTFNCPACNSENVIIEDNASYTIINYCNDCGQRLDWSENDE